MGREVLVAVISLALVQSSCLMLWEPVLTPSIYIPSTTCPPPDFPCGPALADAPPNQPPPTTHSRRPRTGSALLQSDSHLGEKEGASLTHQHNHSSYSRASPPAPLGQALSTTPL